MATTDRFVEIEVPDSIVEEIHALVALKFKEITGRDMPESFSSFQFRKEKKQYGGGWSCGLYEGAALKAVGLEAAPVAKGGNVAPSDAEMRAAIVAWVDHITAGQGKLNDVPEVIRAAVSRALQPVESLMPPTKKSEPASLMPPTKKEAPAVPPKGSGMLSMAAVKAQLKRAEKARKAG